MNRFLLTLFVHGYSGFIELLRLFALPFFEKSAWGARANLSERMSIPYLERDVRKTEVVWIHAASLGEAKVVFKFLDILREKYPRTLYVLTATTKTGLEYLQNMRNESVCGVGFLPLDSLRLMHRLLRRFRVSRVWLVETELWPCLLYACFRARVPVGIVNARLEARSMARYRIGKVIIKPLLRAIDSILAQNDTYALRFEELGVDRTRIAVVGNLKAYISIGRPARERWLNLRKQLSIAPDDFVIAAGCLHNGEGAVMARACRVLGENGMPVKCIVVPRYLQEVREILSELPEGALYLREIKTGKAWDICCIDKMGILDEVYALADVAVVGGTFVPVGGHNVWDALRFGVPVFFGPDYHTQQESCERLIAGGVGFSVRDGEQLAEGIQNVMRREPKKFIEAISRFSAAVNGEQSNIRHLIP
ncbi:MAG: glycosyltransferase N-terminal domain-containing protein [Chitinivibrionales bacterium]|nr:glycosyltransferase N-terminal domain-containing protein [Chitinivibrionales bacterium]